MNSQRFIAEFRHEVGRPIGRRTQIPVTRPTCSADHDHR